MKKVVYYLESEETHLVVNRLQNQTNEFNDVDFVTLSQSGLWRISHPPSGSTVFHESQKSFPQYCALIWGSGEKHDVSLIMSPSVPFRKSVDDAHDDFNDLGTRLKGVNEATHNSVLLLYNREAKEVEVIGNHNSREEYVHGGRGPNFTTIDKRFFQHRTPSSYISNPSPEVIHKSIDLDVIGGFPARHDWQNNPGAGLSLEELRADLEKLCATNKVVRFDIGGLHLPTSDEVTHYKNGIVNPRVNSKSLDFAINCYHVLLETYLAKIPEMV